MRFDTHVRSVMSCAKSLSPIEQYTLSYYRSGCSSDARPASPCAVSIIWSGSPRVWFIWNRKSTMCGQATTVSVVKNVCVNEWVWMHALSALIVTYEGQSLPLTVARLLRRSSNTWMSSTRRFWRGLGYRYVVAKHREWNVLDNPNDVCAESNHATKCSRK